MSPSPSPDPTRAAESRPSPGAAESRLRTVLRLNGAFSLVTGLVGLAAAGPVADLLGVDASWPIRLVGGGLVPFAAAVAWIAGAPRSALHRWAGAVSAADLGWVAATVVVLAGGWLSTAGAVILGVIGLVVLDLGLGQLAARRRLGGRPPFAVTPPD
jgi:hypothetical protein